MTEKHTPGPWTYKLQEPSDNYLGKKPFWYVISGADGRTLCNIWHLQEPDASLIAAAPDLLEACAFALKGLAAIGDADLEDWQLDAMDKLQAAISKARGA